MHNLKNLKTLHIENPRLQNLIDWFPKEFLKNLNRVLVVDPLLDNNLIQCIEYLRVSNPILIVTISTLGQSEDKGILAKLASLDCIVRFEIDGTSQQLHEISKKSNLEKCIINAQHFIAKGGVAVWDMSIYKHNENDVEKAKKLAGSLGFRQFVSKSKPNKQYKPSEIYPTKKIVKSKLATCDINCLSRSDNFVFVTAQGHLYPCQWTAMNESKLVSTIDLNKQNFSDALVKLKAYESSFANNSRLKICATTCGNY